MDSHILKEMRFCVVSDVHLGSRRNSTEKIVDNLNREINNFKFLKTIDTLFIAGDLFDELLSLSDPAVDHIEVWIFTLMRNCALSGVKLRVLEGTPSHDRGQSFLFNMFEKIISSMPDGAVKLDVKYVKDLSIEKFDEYGIHVLYVPDEWGTTTTDTLEQVRDLLIKHELESVDLAIMHGLFEYQAPNGIKHIQTHNQEAYEAIVTSKIYIGHIHTPSSKGKVVAQGSFDRLRHNEEEPKGFVRALLKVDGSVVTEFIENSGAAIYKTIYCAETDTADTLMRISEVVKDLPVGANLRIEAHYENPIHSNMSVLKQRWPLFEWTNIARDKAVVVSETILDQTKQYTPIYLDRQNIARVMTDRLGEKGVDADTIALCDDALLEVIQSF